MKKILTIAGSDSSGGAGIQGDSKTILAHGAHPLTVITAITAQNSTSILSVEPVKNVADQLRTLSEDMAFDGIKIGMLYNTENVKAVTEFLDKVNPDKRIPTVLDPIMFATTGKALLEEEAIKSIKELFKRVSLITPNAFEAEFLSGQKISNKESASLVIRLLYNQFKVPVLLKGGHILRDSEKEMMSVDYLYDGENSVEYKVKRLENVHTHGTGCCLSSAITCQLANGLSMNMSIQSAKAFVYEGIQNGYQIGKGEGLMDPLIHFITNTVTMNDVANTCLSVGGRPIMAEAVEEMEDIVPVNEGLVINLGTINKDKLETMKRALNFIDVDRQKVLLDPVGCSSSKYRLNAAKQLLDTGMISILKLNTREALSLCDSQIGGAYGVDSDELDLVSKEKLAISLYNLFNKNKEFYIVITGEVDVVVGNGNKKILRGGTGMQKKITGTGCMLNAVIMTMVTRSPNTFGAIVRSVTHMNQASLRATKKLNNKKYLMTYKQLLIDELSRMNKDLYLITDEKLDFELECLPKTEEALQQGVKILQYRVKNKSRQEKYDEARKLRDLTIKYGVTFIVNDDIKLAKAVKADGVHLGLEDESVNEARRVLGDKCIIGATAKTVNQALKAEGLGADYLGVGALNPSPTKPDAIPVDIEGLKAIHNSVQIPIYGIGGIRHHNLDVQTLKYIDGVALISAVYAGGKEEVTKIMEIIDQ